MNKIIINQYGNGVKATASVLNEQYRIRTKRYKGKGRPRESDYDYLTIEDMQKQMDRLFIIRWTGSS